MGEQSVDNSTDVIQQLGNNNCVHNYNAVGLLKISPKEVEIKAIVNHSWVATAQTAIGLAVFMGIVFMEQSSLGLSIGMLSTMMIMIVVFFLGDKLMLKVPSWHVVYKDGVLTVDGRERAFYSEIYDVQYITNRFNWPFLIITGVTPKGYPYEQKIKFLNNGAAKYVHASFWDGKRIETYEKSLLKEEKKEA